MCGGEEIRGEEASFFVDSRANPRHGADYAHDTKCMFMRHIPELRNNLPKGVESRQIQTHTHTPTHRFCPTVL